MWAEVVGIAASVFTAASIVPQLIRIVKTKEAEAVSIYMLLLLVSECVMWVYYGFLKKDWIIISSNFFAFLINLAAMILTLKYKRDLAGG